MKITKGFDQENDTLKIIIELDRFEIERFLLQPEKQLNLNDLIQKIDTLKIITKFLESVKRDELNEASSE